MGWLSNFAAKLVGKAIKKKLDLKEGPVEDKKKWFESKGIWTGIVTVLIGVYESIRMSLAPELGWNVPVIPEFVYVILGAIGVYARKVADKKVG